MSCRSSSPVVSTAGIEAAFAAPPDPSALLASTLPSLRGQPVYAYIVTTIKTRPPDYRLQQTGCAPNFHGGRITLCTCKHKDRATFKPASNQDDPWKKVWVAGLTSKTEDPSRSLAYLMCVERSFLSQMDLWRELPDKCRRAKCASNSPVGDLYEPKPASKRGPFDPLNYNAPVAGHAHSPGWRLNSWHNDIVRWRGSKPHRLLLGQAAQSYRWTHTRMILKLNVIGHSAHHRLYDSLAEFIDDLQEFEP
jgi:hypothetical protein